MAVQRVRLAPQFVHGVDQALFGSSGRDALRNPAIALDRAELLGEILLPADAAARHPGIEEIGAETHLYGNLRPQRYRLLQSPLSNKTPRADNIGNHVNLQ